MKKKKKTSKIRNSDVISKEKAAYKQARTEQTSYEYNPQIIDDNDRAQIKSPQNTDLTVTKKFSEVIHQ